MKLFLWQCAPWTSSRGDGRSARLVWPFEKNLIQTIIGPTPNGQIFGPTKVEMVKLFLPALSRDYCNNWSTAIQVLNFNMWSWDQLHNLDKQNFQLRVHSKLAIFRLGLGRGQKIDLAQTSKLTNLTWHICLRLYITRHMTGKSLAISYWVEPWNRSEFHLNEVIFVAVCTMNFTQRWQEGVRYWSDHLRKTSYRQLLAQPFDCKWTNFGPIKVEMVRLFLPALSRDYCNNWSTAIQALNFVRAIPFIFHTPHTEECERKHSPWIFHLILTHQIGL